MPKKYKHIKTFKLSKTKKKKLMIIIIYFFPLKIDLFDIFESFWFDIVLNKNTTV